MLPDLLASLDLGVVEALAGFAAVFVTLGFAGGAAITAVIAWALR